MNKKILFRADGNSKTGLGHLYRMFALVEMYKEQYDFVFLTKEDSILNIIPSDYKVKTIPSTSEIDKEPYWININFSPQEYIIIADGYQFVSCYQKKIKELGFSLMYIDDLANEYMFADTVINHSPGITTTNYNAEEYTKFGLGAKFAILRPGFLKAAKQKRHIEYMDTAFVCFGGADSLDLTNRAVWALNHFSKIRNIHVVLGGAYKHTEIYEFAKDKDHIHIHKDLSEKKLLSLMGNCNIAIAPASTILYELCAVKMPILSGYFVENQKNIYSQLAEKKAVFEGGDFTTFNVEDFIESIKRMLLNKNIEKYMSIQQRLIDGMSDIRLKGMINRLSISIRKADKDDMLQVYNWSNDQLVRQNSYHPEPIALDDHETWFITKINHPKTIFLIIEVNGNPAGLIRYDLKKGHSVVGILVSKEYRGQGLAGPFLKESANKYFKSNKEPIFAYIKKKNISSIKSFEKAGYSYFKEDVIEGEESFVYKMEK